MKRKEISQLPLIYSVQFLHKLAAHLTYFWVISIAATCDILTVCKFSILEAKMSVTDKLVPKIHAEEEVEEEEEEEDLVDPAAQIKEACAESSECSKYKARFDECTSRVESKNATTETCFEEILDFYHCMDHCASKDIFSKVK